MLILDLINNIFNFIYTPCFFLSYNLLCCFVEISPILDAVIRSNGVFSAEQFNNFNLFFTDYSWSWVLKFKPRYSTTSAFWVYVFEYLGLNLSWNFWSSGVSISIQKLYNAGYNPADIDIIIKYLTVDEICLILQDWLDVDSRHISLFNSLLKQNPNFQENLVTTIRAFKDLITDHPEVTYIINNLLTNITQVKLQIILLEEFRNLIIDHPQDIAAIKSLFELDIISNSIKNLIQAKYEVNNDLFSHIFNIINLELCMPMLEALVEKLYIAGLEACVTDLQIITNELIFQSEDPASTLTAICVELDLILSKSPESTHEWIKTIQHIIKQDAPSAFKYIDSMHSLSVEDKYKHMTIFPRLVGTSVSIYIDTFYSLTNVTYMNIYINSVYNLLSVNDEELYRYIWHTHALASPYKLQHIRIFDSLVSPTKFEYLETMHNFLLNKFLLYDNIYDIIYKHIQNICVLLDLDKGKGISTIQYLEKIYSFNNNTLAFKHIENVHALLGKDRFLRQYIDVIFFFNDSFINKNIVEVNELIKANAAANDVYNVLKPLLKYKAEVLKAKAPSQVPALMEAANLAASKVTPLMEAGKSGVSTVPALMEAANSAAFKVPPHAANAVAFKVSSLMHAGEAVVPQITPTVTSIPIIEIFKSGSYPIEGQWQEMWINEELEQEVLQAAEKAKSSLK